DSCPVRAFCATRDPESLPVKKPRRKTVALAERCAFVFLRGRILLEQRDAARWRGLWTLPAISNFKSQVSDLTPLVRVVFPFTHHRVTLEVFRARAPRPLAKNQRWFESDSLDHVAMPSPHRPLTARVFATGTLSERLP